MFLLALKWQITYLLPVRCNEIQALEIKFAQCVYTSQTLPAGTICRSADVRMEGGFAICPDQGGRHKSHESNNIIRNG